MFEYCTGCKYDDDDFDNDTCCNCLDGAEFEPSMPYPKGHPEEGKFYCKACSDENTFTYNQALQKEECEAFEKRT